MLVYKDIISGDEMFADSYPVKEVENGFFYEVEGKWTSVGAVEVDIGANPSAEEAEEGVEDSSRKVVDIIDSFRLSEQPTYDKKAFMGWCKPWINKVLEKLPADKKDEFKEKSQAGIKHILGRLKELQFFLGESGEPEASLAFAFYREGASDPTFLFFKYALTEEKC